MIDIGSFQSKTCSGVSRRSFLKLAASVPAALGLPTLAATAAQTPAPRAKSVIFVFLWGAPSHLDTCDPKPNAPAEYRGPFGVISTRTPGMHFTELLPQVAQRSHRYSVIRSHVSVSPGHPDAGTELLTGYQEKPVVYPNYGSIISKHRGHQGDLPPFVSITNGYLADSQRRIDGFGGGTLGGAYDPIMMGCSEQGEVNIPALRLLDDLNPLRINDRKRLLTQLDRVPRMIDASPVTSWDRNFSQAYNLLLKPAARKAFDLTSETEETRARYGQSVFGQSALLARRLVEAGVPYIQLNYSQHPEAINIGYEFGWDTHIYNFEMLQDQHCPIFDRVYSALLDDLYDRGLIDNTLVVCMGEFGRTPKITPRAARDHWPPCYFSLWAGAGIEPGRLIGQSDKYGEHPKTEPITPLMIGTTIAELAGINTPARSEMRVLEGGNPINGII